MENFEKLYDAEVEESAAIGELKTDSDKYSLEDVAEDVKQALERSKEGIFLIQAHLTKVTSP